MKIDFEFNDDGARRVFANLTELSVDLSKPLRASADVLYQNVRQTFRDEASPWGEPWQPHSPVTLKERKRKKNIAPPIVGSRESLLVETGRMYSSIRTTYAPDEATVSIGGDDIFAAVHQFGNPGNKAWGKADAPIPARPFFPVRDGEADLPFDWAEEAFEPFAVALRKATV